MVRYYELNEGFSSKKYLPYLEAAWNNQVSEHNLEHMLDIKMESSFSFEIPLSDEDRAIVSSKLKRTEPKKYNHLVQGDGIQPNADDNPNSIPPLEDNIELKKLNDLINLISQKITPFEGKLKPYVDQGYVKYKEYGYNYNNDFGSYKLISNDIDPKTKAYIENLIAEYYNLCDKYSSAHKAHDKLENELQKQHEKKHAEIISAHNKWIKDNTTSQLNPFKLIVNIHLVKRPNDNKYSSYGGYCSHSLQTTDNNPCLVMDCYTFIDVFEYYIDKIYATTVHEFTHACQSFNGSSFRHNMSISHYERPQEHESEIARLAQVLKKGIPNRLKYPGISFNNNGRYTYIDQWFDLRYLLSFSREQLIQKLYSGGVPKQNIIDFLTKVKNDIEYSITNYRYTDFIEDIKIYLEREDIPDHAQDLLNRIYKYYSGISPETKKLLKLFNAGPTPEQKTMINQAKNKLGLKYYNI